MTPQEIIDRREEQIQQWIRDGYITLEQIQEIEKIWRNEDV